MLTEFWIMLLGDWCYPIKLVRRNLCTFDLECKAATTFVCVCVYVFWQQSRLENRVASYSLTELLSGSSSSLIPRVPCGESLGLHGMFRVVALQESNSEILRLGAYVQTWLAHSPTLPSEERETFTLEYKQIFCWGEEDL